MGGGVVRGFKSETFHSSTENYIKLFNVLCIVCSNCFN